MDADGRDNAGEGTMMVDEDSPEDRAEARPNQSRRRAGRRLLTRFVSADSYGLVLVLVVMTYAVSFVSGWAQTVALAIQLVTV